MDTITQSQRLSVSRQCSMISRYGLAIDTWDKDAMRDCTTARACMHVHACDQRIGSIAK